MAMSKKDYEAIASIISDAVNEWEEVAGKLSAYFESDNPRFNPVRFMTAAGINIEVEG